jgi:Zn-dependent protease
MAISSANIRWILIYLFVLVISVAMHEFGHAFVADRLGDDTPRRQGRVTLNPLAHADLFGTFILPLVGSIYGAATGAGGGFGWGKPVEWQPHRIGRRVSMTTAKVLVAIAGPSMNLLIAIVVATVHVVLLAHHAVAPSDTDLPGISEILQFAVTTNFILFFFNLLPLPPLDGGHVAQSFTPYRYRETFDAFARFSPFILLGVMLIPQAQRIFSWPAMVLAEHLYRGLAHVFA